MINTLRDLDRKVNKRVVTKIRLQGSEVKYLHKPFNHGCKLLMDSKLPRIYIWLVMRETNIYNKRNLDNWLIFSGDNVSGATSWSMHKTHWHFWQGFWKVQHCSNWFLLYEDNLHSQWRRYLYPFSSSQANTTLVSVDSPVFWGQNIWTGKEITNWNHYKSSE